MKTQSLVAPSILSADFANLQKEVEALAQAGADWVHVDVMDGHFVPNLTIGAPVVKSLKAVTPLPLDVHLMIEEPERYIEDFVSAGADYLTIHVESTEQVESTLKSIRQLGARPGITLRPGTAIEEIYPYLGLVDLVLIMTVNPGFGGQSFMLEQVGKIAAVKEQLEEIGSSALIEVDGGVNEQTVSHLLAADVFVAGSYVFNCKEGYAHAIEKLKRRGG